MIAGSGMNALGLAMVLAEGVLIFAVPLVGFLYAYFAGFSTRATIATLFVCVPLGMLARIGLWPGCAVPISTTAPGYPDAWTYWWCAARREWHWKAR